MNFKSKIFDKINLCMHVACVAVLHVPFDDFQSNMLNNAVRIIMRTMYGNSILQLSDYDELVCEWFSLCVCGIFVSHFPFLF